MKKENFTEKKLVSMSKEQFDYINTKRNSCQFIRSLIDKAKKTEQKNIDASELHELSVELAHNILLNVDPHRSEGNHKFDIEFKFKGNSAFANGDVEFEYYKNNLVHVSTTFEMDMFDKDGEDVEFNMPDDNEVAELIKIFC